ARHRPSYRNDAVKLNRNRTLTSRFYGVSPSSQSTASPALPMAYSAIGSSARLATALYAAPSARSTAQIASYTASHAVARGVIPSLSLLIIPEPFRLASVGP